LKLKEKDCHRAVNNLFRNSISNCNTASETKIHSLLSYMYFSQGLMSLKCPAWGKRGNRT
jgi:hypothetical protein